MANNENQRIVKPVMQEETYNRKALLKESIQIAWPAVLESFFVSLAGMIDTLMVSSLGTYAVAAVGLTVQPKFICLSVFFAINVAVSALVARRKGQGDKAGANRVLITSLILSVLVCAAISFLSVGLADPIISLCGSASDTHQPAVDYFTVIQAGMVFNVFTMLVNAAQRGAGNTIIAMQTNVVSSLVNICFNYLLIGGNFGFPALGLYGAAIATVLGTVVSAIMALLSLLRENSYVSLRDIVRDKIRPSLEVLKSIYRLAVNLLVENIAMRIGFMATSIMAAHLGTDPFAAHQVGMNFLSLGFSFGDGMQAAAVALIGRSLGEQRPMKAKKYGSICQQVGLALSILLGFVCLVFGRDLFRLFFDADDVLAMGVVIMRYISVIVLFQISQVINSGCLRGAGDVRYCLYVALLSVALIRTAVTWVLTGVCSLGLHGIWIGVLSDQLSRFLLLRHRFTQGSWTKISI